MLKFLKRKKVEPSAREALVAEIEETYDVWLRHICEMSREIKLIPELESQQATVEKLMAGDYEVVKEGNNAETLKQMDAHYSARINECARTAISEFRALGQAWGKICQLRSRLDATTQTSKEVD